MSFTREKTKDFYMLTTDVENIFINEYMPIAPGEYVKVYLYGLFYSQTDMELTHEQMAGQLNLTEVQVEEAWEFWSQLGLVVKTQKGMDYDIEFRQLRSLMYGSPEGESQIVETRGEAPASAEKTQSLYDEELKDLVLGIEALLGKTLSPKETREIFFWVEEVGATLDVIKGAVAYCIEKGKTGINYMTKVIEQWTCDGLKTDEDVKTRLEEAEQRYSDYKQILQTLGLNRGVTKAEKEMIDKWFDEMNFNRERVLEACIKGSFISNPNLRYVNGILEKWYDEAKACGHNVNCKLSVTQADLNKYYEFLRKKAEEDAQARKAEVYQKIPRIEEVDKELIVLGKKLSRSLLGGDSKSLAEEKRLMNLLEEERAVLLTENNFSEDYTDIKYSCSQCNDTGVSEDGGRCECTKKRIGEAELWQNSSLAKK
ncbi:MAG: DnaD domain protein [Firmicutes bacterium]|nr:DnaD domain protein [Bacillota bacterium]